jgi:pyrimidine-nucleoside phosphorylase
MNAMSTSAPTPIQWIIEKKRDGQELPESDIHRIIRDYATGDLPDYQMAAFAMAVYFQGMTDTETAALTVAMQRTGTTLDFSDVAAPKIDKHSTGGVGDKISLILAPLAAATGLAVPMIAGRGLGATGGTIDKLESIPGYRTDLDDSAFKKVLLKCGCSIVGQSATIAPADKRLYALRDVTGTVPSIPLIVASILSKKMAAGLDGLILDVKWGHGAFMQDYTSAKRLASSLTGTANHLGLRCQALLTDMNQPLGHAAGNAPEVAEAADVLRNQGPADVRELTIVLCAHMLCLGAIFNDVKAAQTRATALLESGAAMEKFLRMVELHGGNPRVFENAPNGAALPQAAMRQTVVAPRSGYVVGVNAGLIGKACVLLGAGRTLVTDTVDPAAGITELKKIGDKVAAGDTLAILHAASQSRLDAATTPVKQAFELMDAQPSPPVLINHG